MSGKARFRAGAAVAVLAILLAVAGAAIAAGDAAPQLLSPNHKHVAQGHIRLVVEIPLTPNRQGVFVAISPAKKLDRQGHLQSTCNRCDFVGPTHWKGDKYSYLAKFDFTGYWAVTPGKYYWQAHYYTVGDTAVYWSPIGTFFVK